LFDHYGRCVVSLAKQVQLVVSDGNHSTGQRIALPVFSLADSLVDISRYEQEDAAQKREGEAPLPKGHNGIYNNTLLYKIQLCILLRTLNA
jgi:hypothetical protein